MHLLPLTDCCLHLGIDPKTLRLWLKAAQLSCCLHPHDARLKCLTASQLQELAALHGRPLPSTLLDCPVPLPQASPPSTQDRSAHPTECWCGHLTDLEQQVTTLHAQVTELALLLSRLSLAQLPQPAHTTSASGVAPAAEPVTASRPAQEPAKAKEAGAPPHPTRKRSRALPLIQVRPDGSVVVIAPTQGVLTWLPETTEWFAWLSSLNAFSFEGLQGSFTATRKFRDGARIQSWMAYRSLHGRSCGLYLGLTSSLTLAHLEEKATMVSTRLTVL